MQWVPGAPRSHTAAKVVVINVSAMLTFSAGWAPFLPSDLKFCFSFSPSIQVPNKLSRQCCAQHPVQGSHWKAGVTQCCSFHPPGGRETEAQRHRAHAAPWRGWKPCFPARAGSHKDNNTSQLSAVTARSEPRIQSDGKSNEASGGSNSCRLGVLQRDGSAHGCPPCGCGVLLPTPSLLSAQHSVQLFSPSLGRLSALPAAMGGFLSLLTQRSVSARRGDERNQYLKMRRQSEAEVPDGWGWAQGGCRAAPHCCLLQHCAQGSIPPTPWTPPASHSREQQHLTNPKLLKQRCGGNVYCEQQSPEAFQRNTFQCWSSLGPKVFFCLGAQLRTKQEIFLEVSSALKGQQSAQLCGHCRLSRALRAPWLSL